MTNKIFEYQQQINKIRQSAKESIQKYEHLIEEERKNCKHKWREETSNPPWHYQYCEWCGSHRQKPANPTLDDEGYVVTHTFGLGVGWLIY